MTNCIGKARQIFPCGLIQPVGTFRCSVDALQIAAFAAMQQDCARDVATKAESSLTESALTECALTERTLAESALTECTLAECSLSECALPKSPVAECTLPERTLRIADVGCGCGVVGLAMLLALKEETTLCVGFEKHPLLVQAARDNAKALGFSAQYEAVEHDVRTPLPSCHVGMYDRVVCNPPWRILGNGRLPKDPARIEALFADDTCFSAFLTRVLTLARAGGWIFVAVGTERLSAVQNFIEATGLRHMAALDVYRPKGRGARLHCVAVQKP